MVQLLPQTHPAWQLCLWLQALLMLRHSRQTEALLVNSNSYLQSAGVWCTTRGVDAGLASRPCRGTRTAAHWELSSKVSAEMMEKLKAGPGQLEMQDGLMPPPDREAALEMLEKNAATSGDESDLGPGAFPELPQPPFKFQAKGEFGDPLLCTDIMWGSALLTLQWLGLPCDIVEAEDTEAEGALLVMGDEYYDDPQEVKDVLEERYVLSDLTQCAPNINKVILGMRTAMEEWVRNKDPQKEEKLKAQMVEACGKVEFRLKRSRGDYVESEEVTLGDMDLTIIAYHVVIALQQLKGWSFPAEFEKLREYCERMHDMQVFKKIAPPVKAIVQKYS